MKTTKTNKMTRAGLGDVKARLRLAKAENARLDRELIAIIRKMRRTLAA